MAAIEALEDLKLDVPDAVDQLALFIGRRVSFSPAAGVVWRGRTVVDRLVLAICRLCAASSQLHCALLSAHVKLRVSRLRPHAYLCMSAHPPTRPLLPRLPAEPWLTTCCRPALCAV